MAKLHFIKVLNLLTLVLLTGSWTLAQTETRHKPDLANVKYGMHERNILDIWFADTTRITPLAIYIHGGGFEEGSKEQLSPIVLQELLKSGISVASINYRFLSDAPLPASYYDALRALQFIRSRADIWRIDKVKIAAFGRSAGAQISMWLAFSDEMANPDAKDPLERESSRLFCVASTRGQTTMDFDLWVNWVPGLQKKPFTKEQIYGKMTDEEYSKTIEGLSPMSIISSDDPPIFMSYSMSPDEPIPSNPEVVRSWQYHHVIFGIKLKEKMDELGVEAELRYPGAESKYESDLDFLKSKLL